MLVAFHVVCVLALASLFKTSRLAPGAIPLWLCSREPGDQAYFHNVLQAVEKKADGSLRFCSKCGAFKPDRTHHCEQLGQCVLVLQHWSLWCNNAIGFYNHKCYLLALLYTAIAHGTAAALLLPSVVRGICDSLAAPVVAVASVVAVVAEEDEGEGLGGEGLGGGVPLPLPPAVAALLRGGEGGVQAWALLSGSISAVLGVGAAAWLVVHLGLIAQGVTAAEWWRQNGCAYRKKPKPPLAGQPFDFAARANLAKAFGRHPVLWLLPTNHGIEGNGIFFELSGADAPADALAARW